MDILKLLLRDWQRQIKSVFGRRQRRFGDEDRRLIQGRPPENIYPMW